MEVDGSFRFKLGHLVHRKEQSSVQFLTLGRPSFFTPFYILILTPGHNPFQYSYLGNPMERGVEWATVYGVSKNRT